MFRFLTSVTLSFLVIGAVLAQGSLSKTVDDVTFYLGLMPAEIVRGHPKEHPESTMHNAPLKDSGSRHVVVALFDAKTGERITDAKVSARVEQVGLAADQKDLEPMQIAGTVTYGNFYAVQSGGIYKIRIIVKRKGGARRIEAEFEYRG